MKRFILLLMLLFSAVIQAENGRVFLITSADTALHQQAATDIIRNIEQHTEDISISLVNPSHLDQLTITHSDLLVPIGKQVINKVSQIQQATILYSLIDRQNIPEQLSSNWAAVVIDQPINRQIALAESVTQNRYNNNVIIAVSNNNQAVIDEVNALDSRIKPKLVIIQENQQPARIMDQILFQAGALIAVRDEHIWTGENAKWMLYQSFKYNVPIIGYSKKFLTAGALVSVYATLSQTTNKTVELILNWQDNGHTLTQTGIVYPDYNIEYNEHIARSFNLPAPSVFK